MKILLAEDEKELSRAVTAILEHSKYAVDTAYFCIRSKKQTERYSMIRFFQPSTCGVYLIMIQHTS